MRPSTAPAAREVTVPSALDALGAALEALLAPLDRVRHSLLAALAPLVRPFIVRRDLRVAAAGVLVVCAALAGAAVSPVWMIFLGPVVWGVPHILADVRYLVVRPGLHRRAAFWLAVGAPVAWAACGGGARAGLLATAGALVIARGAWARRLAGLAVVGALFAGAVHLGARSDLYFAHAHHFVTVAIWWRWRARTSRVQYVPLALFVAACVGLLLVDVPAIAAHGGLGASRVHSGIAPLAAGLAPGLSAAMGARLVVVFAFAQAVHYAIWLRLVPEDDRPQATPRTFQKSLRALRADFTLPLVVLGCAAAAAVTLWAVRDLGAARATYARFTWFHGHLELAAAALLWAEKPRGT